MLPERRTVGALLAHLAQTMPQQEAVVFPPRRLTYAMLYTQATAVAAGLWQLGIRPGEPVALLMSNRPEWITVALGCALIGAPVVAISTWSRRMELEYVLDHSQAVALVTLDRFLGADYQALLAEIVPKSRSVHLDSSVLLDSRRCASSLSLGNQHSPRRAVLTKYWRWGATWTRRWCAPPAHGCSRRMSCTFSTPQAAPPGPKALP